MRRSRIRTAVVAALFAAPLSACGPGGSGASPAVGSSANSGATATAGTAPASASADLSATGAAAVPTNPAPGSCHVRPGPLPDPACTPGVLNPNATQDNLASTVCKPGWTATIRPPASYTNRLKRMQIAAYGYPDTNMSDYEEDHLISLELGGSPSDPRNLWPEAPPSPNPKDKIENDLHRAICAHKITLAAAQKAIATNWTTAEHVVGIG